MNGNQEPENTERGDQPRRGQRPGWVPAVVGLGAAAVLIGGGVFVAGQFPERVPAPAATSPTVTQEPQPTTEPEESQPAATQSASRSATSETAEPESEVEWERFTTPSGLMSFELPSDWTVEPGDFYLADELLVVYNADGVPMATLANGVAPTGMACGPEQWDYTILDSKPVNLPAERLNPRSIDPVFSYRVLKSDPMVVSYGITAVTGGVNGKKCVLNNSVYTTGKAGIYVFANHPMVRPLPDGQDVPGYRELRVNSVDEAVAYQQTQEYAQIKRMITSLRISQ